MSTLSFLTQEFSGEFVPLYDQLLVREFAPEEMIGSIVIPEDARKGPDGDKFLSRGVVVAIGPGDALPPMFVERCEQCNGARIVPDAGGLEACEQCGGLCSSIDLDAPVFGRVLMQVQPGDTVIFDRPSNRKIKLDGVDYFVCHEEQHILAVIGQ